MMQVKSATDDDVAIVYGVVQSAVEVARTLTRSTRDSMIMMFTVQLATMMRCLFPNETRPATAKLFRALADAIEQGEQNGNPPKAIGDATNAAMVEIVKMMQLIDAQQKGPPS